MQRHLSRLAWRNLSIQAKTGLFFAFLLLLVSLIALSGFVALSTVRTQVSTATTTTGEMRTLMRDIQLQVEDLQRLQGRLVDEFDQSGFNPLTTTIDDDYNQLAENLLNDDLSRLEPILFELSRPGSAPAIAAELGSFKSHVNDSQAHFERTFSLVTELTRPDDGALALLSQQGDALDESVYEATLQSRLIMMRSFERSLLRTGGDELDALQEAADSFLNTYNQRAPVGMQDTQIPQMVEDYLQQANTVAVLLDEIELTNNANQVTLNFLRTTASRLDSIAESRTREQFEVLDQIQATARLVMAVGLGLVLVTGSFLTYLFGRDLARRLTSLVGMARQFEGGDLEARADIPGEDEFSQLALSFNAMAVQLEGLVGGLEQRVAERTRDLSITAEIGRAVVTVREPRDLMNEVVELIRRRFGFYHAQVFLIDDARENANLVASTGTAGRELLARQHSLSVGSQSVIGQVTERAEPVIASDTDASLVHRRNELLPDTRSEMALPMRIGDQVIGALDVQSVAPNAFDADDVAVFQIMADQLAIALENARLYADLERARASIVAIERRATGEAWRAYGRERAQSAPLGYRFQEESLEPLSEQPPSAMGEALRSGRLITMKSGDSEISLAVPIKVRGEVIGAFGFGGEDLHSLSEEDIALLETVAARVGLALENLRLVEQTARRAEHEQIINEITAKIVGSTDVSDILQTTVKELGRVLHAPQTSVQLRQELKGEGHE
jgi:GAF domain-containing protein/HAMP domain-containing protein